MKIAIIGEGPSDKSTIPILARKIIDNSGQSRGIVPIKAPKGDLFQARKVEGLLDALMSIHDDILKVIVCVDCECTDPDTIRPILNSIALTINRRGEYPPLSYVVVVHSLESWILCARKSICAFVRDRCNLPNSPEAICRPYEEVVRIFDRYGKDFEKTIHNPSIANDADVQEIAARSPSFCDFQRAILDP